MDQREEARTYYRRALRTNPNDEHSLYELANCYEDDGMMDKWIHFYSRFVEEHPYSKVGWFCLGEGYCAAGLYEKAIDAYQYAIAIDADFYYAYMQLAACHSALGDQAKAVAALHDACEHTQDKAYVYFRIGEIYRFQDNAVTANIYYRKAIDEDPFYAEAWHTMSTCYAYMREFGLAVDAAQRALKIDPESPIYLTTLAMIYADSGNYEDADKMFECAKPYFADFEQGWLALADYKIMIQHYDEAIDALCEGLRDCEMVLEFNKRLALCYYSTGRRNMLYNAVRACLMEGEPGVKALLEYFPELADNLEVMNIVHSYLNDDNSEQDNKID